VGKKRIAMKVMKNPKNVMTAVQSEDTSFYSPLIIGDGDIDYSCGKCGKVLCTNMSESQLKGIILICSKCGSFNEVWTDSSI
jgi:predicted RNA-binding Zn-ribbon protein involved in translation (DUF1610 family)